MKENPNFKVDPNLSKKTYERYEAPPRMDDLPKNNNNEEELESYVNPCEGYYGFGLGATTDAVHGPTK